MGVLSAEYGKKEFAKKNYYSQKDGDVVYRIIPALTQFTNNPRDWAKYHSIVFGYKTAEGKVRPFESVQVKRNKIVEIEDPAVKRIEDLKSKLAKAKEEKNDELVAKLNALVGFGGTYSIDNNFHMNVVDLQGNIGTLKLRISAKELLDIEIEKLMEKGVDPLSLDNGRYFVFTRTGSGNATTFKVSVYKEQIDSPEYGRVERDVIHKITPELLAKIEREAQDLSKIAPKLTVDEVARIVASADIATGKTAVCNELFDNRWKSERDARKSGPAAAPAQAAPAPAAQPQESAPTPTPVTATSTTVRAATNMASPVQAAPVQAPAAVVLTTPVAAEQSHEDWLKEIGIDPNESNSNIPF